MADSLINSGCHLGTSFSITLTVFSAISSLLGAAIYDINAGAMIAASSSGTPLLGCIVGCCLNFAFTSLSNDKSQNTWGKPKIALRDSLLWVSLTIPATLGSLLGRAFLQQNQTLQNIPLKTQVEASLAGNTLFFITLASLWCSCHGYSYVNQKKESKEDAGLLENNSPSQPTHTMQV